MRARLMIGSLMIGVLFALTGCGSVKSDEQQAEAEQASVTGDAPEPSTAQQLGAKISSDREFDEDRATEASEDSLVGETYLSAEGTSECSTGECEGHQAGWEWAQNGHDSCNGSSDAFNAGCQAYLDEIDEGVENARASFEKGDDTFLKKGDDTN